MLVLNEEYVAGRLAQTAESAGLSVITPDSEGIFRKQDGSFAVFKAPERRIEIPAHLLMEDPQTLRDQLLSARPHSYNAFMLGNPIPVQINGNPPAYLAWFMKID